MATVRDITIYCDGPCKQVVKGTVPDDWLILKAEHVSKGHGKQYRFGRLMLCANCFGGLAEHGYVLDSSPGAADKLPADAQNR